MMNDPRPPDKPRHPLEEAPVRRPEPADPDPSLDSAIVLTIPAVPARMTYVLVAINLIVFVAGLLRSQLGDELFFFGANQAYAVLVWGDYYRLVTSMFLHGGAAHIFFNMYALYVIGRSIEPVFGSARFTLIYLLGGLAGSILSTVMHIGNLTNAAPSVGASGAVFALFGAEIIYLYRHRHIMGQYASQQLRSLFMLLAINLFIGLASWTGSSSIRIDNWAHLGGLAGGLALTWLIGPVLNTTADPTQPNHQIAHDTNPPAKNYGLISLYSIVLVAILALFSFLAR